MDSAVTPKISIIVPIFNAERGLMACLESIQKQTFNDFEVIMIDDGSTDDSGSICNHFSKRDSRFRYLHQANSGVSKARNLGMKSSSGAFITFIDSDDTVSRRHLETLFGLMKDNVDIASCGYSKTPIQSDDHTEMINKKTTSYSGESQIVKLLQSDHSGYVWNKLYRRGIIVRNHLKFDEELSMCEDLYFNLQYINLSRGMLCNPHKTYYYTEGNGLSKNITDEWFSSLAAFNKMLMLSKQKYSSNVQYYFAARLILQVYAAEARCEILGHYFPAIMAKYDIDLLLLKNKYRLRCLLTNHYIDTKDKIVLCAVYIFPIMAKAYFMHKAKLNER